VDVERRVQGDENAEKYAIETAKHAAVSEITRAMNKDGYRVADEGLMPGRVMQNDLTFSNVSAEFHEDRAYGHWIVTLKASWRGPVQPTRCTWTDESGVQGN
jgi:hypothetical protein